VDRKDGWVHVAGVLFEIREPSSLGKWLNIDPILRGMCREVSLGHRECREIMNHFVDHRRWSEDVAVVSKAQ
jgi:hypothetical protein